MNTSRMMCVTAALLLLTAASARAAGDLIETVKRGDLKNLMRLVDAGADVNTADAEGLTLLHYAVLYNRPQMVNFLVSRKARINGKDKFGQTPLMLVVEKTSSEKLAPLLLELGADPFINNNAGDSPLHYASQFGKMALVKLLLSKGVPVDIRTGNAEHKGYTPLHISCERGRTDVARYLVSKGADVHARTTDGKTPLIIAAAYTRVPIVQLLLQKGADINAVESRGWTALHCAASQYAFRYRYAETIRFLLARGADRSRRDKQGKTALDIARERKHDEAAKLLEK